MDGFHLPPFWATSSMVAITTIAPRLYRSSASSDQPSPPSLPLVVPPTRGGRVRLRQALCTPAQLEPWALARPLRLGPHVD